jgi:hypothetical protein
VLAWLAIAGLVALTWALPAMPATVAVLTCRRDPVRACGAAAPAGERPASARAPAHRNLAVDGRGRRHVAAGDRALRHSGPQLCGLVAAIPLVGMFARARRLSARRRAADAPGFSGATSTAWRPRRRSSAPWPWPWALDAGAWAWPIGLAAAAIALRAKHHLRQGAQPIDSAGSLASVMAP